MVKFTPDVPSSDPEEQGPPFPVGDHDFVLTNHAAIIDDHTGALQAHDKALEAIITHLSGEPGGPWQWERLDRAQASKLWGELVAFVSFLDRRYLRYLGGQGARVVADWYKHPVLVEMFTALMVAYQHAYSKSSRVPSFALVEWHERCLWPTFDRIEHLRLLQGSPDQDEWAGPDPLPTHDGFPERFEAFLADDLSWRPEPEPKPNQPAEAPRSPARAARPAKSPAGSEASVVGHGADPASGDLPVLSDDDAPVADDAPPPPPDYP